MLTSIITLLGEKLAKNIHDSVKNIQEPKLKSIISQITCYFIKKY